VLWGIVATFAVGCLSISIYAVFVIILVGTAVELGIGEGFSFAFDRRMIWPALRLGLEQAMQQRHPNASWLAYARFRLHFPFLTAAPIYQLPSL
jgi:hypothetical protein